MSDDFVTISMSEWLEIKERLDKLDALEAGGVDNWEGYDFAMEEFYEQ